MKFFVSNLRPLLEKIKNIFGFKSTVDQVAADRRQYLLEIEYDTELAFNTEALVSITNSPYVGSARVGQTYIA